MISTGDVYKSASSQIFPLANTVFKPVSSLSQKGIKNMYNKVCRGNLKSNDCTTKRALQHLEYILKANIKGDYNFGDF